MSNKPELMQVYTTAKSGVTGLIVEMVPNRTGSIRLRLITTTLETRWTTWVPSVVEDKALDNLSDAQVDASLEIGR
jgi:hypothetical protein